MEYYSAIKKKNAICNNMDGLGGHYTSRNKSEKDKYCKVSLTCEV